MRHMHTNTHTASLKVLVPLVAFVLVCMLCVLGWSVCPCQYPPPSLSLIFRGTVDLAQPRCRWCASNLKSEPPCCPHKPEEGEIGGFKQNGEQHEHWDRGKKKSHLDLIPRQEFAQIGSLFLRLCSGISLTRWGGFVEWWGIIPKLISIPPPSSSCPALLR